MTFPSGVSVQPLLLSNTSRTTPASPSVNSIASWFGAAARRITGNGPKGRHLDFAERLAIFDFAHRFFAAKRIDVPLKHHVYGRDFRRLFALSRLRMSQYRGCQGCFSKS